MERAKKSPQLLKAIMYAAAEAEKLIPVEPDSHKMSVRAGFPVHRTFTRSMFEPRLWS